MPQPNDGWHWSIAHTREWAAAVVSREPAGIDLEKIRPRREGVFESVASANEWQGVGERSWDSFFRMWTAKEAVLKANGKGIGWLLECVFLEITSSVHCTLRFRNRDWHVEHFLFSDHVAAVTCNDVMVQWQMSESSQTELTRHRAKG